MHVHMHAKYCIALLWTGCRYTSYVQYLININLCTRFSFSSGGTLQLGAARLVASIASSKFLFEKFKKCPCACASIFPLFLHEQDICYCTCHSKWKRMICYLTVICVSESRAFLSYRHPLVPSLTWIREGLLYYIWPMIHLKYGNDGWTVTTHKYQADSQQWYTVHHIWTVEFSARQFFCYIKSS